LIIVLDQWFNGTAWGARAGRKSLRASLTRQNFPSPPDSASIR
jgi:hypothetical protein